MKAENLSIREFTGFKTLKDVFIDMLDKMANLVSKNFTTDEENFTTDEEKREWLEECWDDYGDDVAEFLWGTLDQNIAENKDLVDDDLLDYCNMYDLAEALKANSESFFGYSVPF